MQIYVYCTIREARNVRLFLNVFTVMLITRSISIIRIKFSKNLTIHLYYSTVVSTFPSFEQPPPPNNTTHHLPNLQSLNNHPSSSRQTLFSPPKRKPFPRILSAGNCQTHRDGPLVIPRISNGNWQEADSCHEDFE